MSSSGPPELPGLIAASVWMALMKDWSPASPPGVTGRFRALTMPLVTVLSRPSGAPTAITWSPTTTELEAPSGSERQAGAVHLDHRQVVGRVAPDDPWPARVVPLENSTVMSPPCAAPATTWLLVRM